MTKVSTEGKGTGRRSIGDFTSLLDAESEDEHHATEGTPMEATTNPGPEMTAIRFTIEFAVPNKISLKALCDKYNYTVPNTEAPYADKTLADGSTIRVTPRNDARKSVIVGWAGPVEDWGAMRFAIDNIYHDLAGIGYVPPLPENR